jgi:hypothetical protein
VSLNHSAWIEASAHHSLDSIPFGILLRENATTEYPLVYPGVPYTHARHTTSGEVKKYQQAFLLPLSGI